MTATLEAVSGAPPSSEGSRTASAPESERVPQRRALELDTVATLWQRALDAALAAIASASGRAGLPGSERAERSRCLVTERQETAKQLGKLATEARIRPAPWLSPVPITPHMLGLPVPVRGCLFDLDGVLTNSDVLHATAWAEVFDDLLLRQSETSGWQFKPFDLQDDYESYVSGRTRLEGIRAFLESRGLRIPEGRPDDSRERDTAYGLAKRKSDALERSLQRRAVRPGPNVRRYLEAAGRANVARAVVSASARTSQMLESAGLATVVDAVIDADVVRHEALRSRPAPDVLLAACRLLGVDPAEAVSFTAAPDGIAAARSAGMPTVGVCDGAARDVLLGFGADRTVAAVTELLDPRLRDDASVGLR